MFGHSPPVVIDAVVEQARKGLTMMLPTEDAIVVGQQLAQRFGIPLW